MAANKSTRQGGTNAKNPEDRYAAARALYEGTPGMSIATLAQQTGLGKSTLERRANSENWIKNFAASLLPTMAEDAQAAADRFNTKVADYGTEITTEQLEMAKQEVVVETAIDMRGQILDRHRREWAVVRGLIGEAVKDRNFDKAKLAKITSESMRNLQDGERKAWGIDKPDGESKLTVVIERG